MTHPVNQAANLVISAQSIITDLTSQAAEIQAAISKQQTLIDALLPVSEWGLVESAEPTAESEKE